MRDHRECDLRAEEIWRLSCDVQVWMVVAYNGSHYWQSCRAHNDKTGPHQGKG